MRFYDQQHEFYCGVDLHTRKMYLCVLDRDGNKRLHRNMRAKPEDFLRAIKPFRDGLVVGVECMFTWYWLADLCLDESLDFTRSSRAFLSPSDRWRWLAVTIFLKIIGDLSVVNKYGDQKW